MTVSTAARHATRALDVWVARPADAARVLLLRTAGPLGRPLVRDRELRVAVVGAATVIAALAATLIAPLWLLLLGPIVWGVPHVLADVRHLVVRPGLHRDRRLALLVGPPLVVAALGGGVLAGLAGCAGVLIAVGASGRRAWGAWVVLAAAAIAALAAGPVRNVVFAHAHNVAALALWAAWRPRRTRLHLIPLVLATAGAAALLSGALDEVVWRSGAVEWTPPGGLPLGAFVGEVAPGAPRPWAARLVLTFAFLQAVHYAVWLRLVPDDDRPRPVAPPYRTRLRALVADMGAPAVAITAALAVGVALWAAMDVVGARAGYLRMAVFHGHLELAALTLWWTRGRP